MRGRKEGRKEGEKLTVAVGVHLPEDLLCPLLRR